MKRDYKEGIKQTPIFFTGTEVEHTPAFGLHTLFVVDIQDPEEVVEYARGYDVQHVYLGANHSFDGSGQEEYGDIVPVTLANFRINEQEIMDIYKQNDVHYSELNI